MVDLQTVCCMCGDVGFPEKLFRCNKCRSRIQHSYPSISAKHLPQPPPPPPPPPSQNLNNSSELLGLSLKHFRIILIIIFIIAIIYVFIILWYCSNYYSEFAEPIEMCDWCQSEQRSSRHGSSSKKSSSGYETGITNRSEYSGDKIKQQDREENAAEKGKSAPTGAPSPRPTTRRYKLLKDVMC